MKATRLKELIVYIVENSGPVSRLKLAKLVYLVDWAFYQTRGTQLTKAYYLRERRGPVPATFGRELDEMVGHEIELKHAGIAAGKRPRVMPGFNESERAVIDVTLRKYARRSERDLLLAAYLSQPMKSILKEERAGSVRRHEGIVFTRFPSQAHERQSTSREPISEESSFQCVQPEAMTEEDACEVMLAFGECLPLMLTAEEVLPGDENSDAAKD